MTETAERKFDVIGGPADGRRVTFLGPTRTLLATPYRIRRLPDKTWAYVAVGVVIDAKTMEEVLEDA